MSTRSAQHPAKPPQLSGRGPGLFTQFYLALFVLAALLTHAVYGAVPQMEWWFYGLLIAFGVLAVVGAIGRDLFHDWFASMTLPGRVWYFLLIAFMFVVPIPLYRQNVIPEGFVLALPLLLPFAVVEPVARLYLAIAMVGFYFALPRSPIEAPYSVLAYGAATLWAFGTAHYAFTGHPFRLRGWWPMRRIVFNVIAYCIPAGLAALMAFSLWREPPKASAPATSGITAPAIAPRTTPLDAEEALVRAAVYMAMIIASLIFLHLVRRFFSRRAKPPNMPEVRMVSVSDVDLRRAEGRPVARGLAGARGQVVKLWWNWAKRHQREDGAAETAAELGDRVANEAASDEAPLEITRLMEMAHYGPAEPTPSQVETMRDLIRREESQEREK